jgi:4-hydroxy-4-methyl-2-oxoglutarate aldolase
VAVSESLSPAVLDALCELDSCAVANAIETFGVRLRNEGFTDGTIRCLFDDRGPVVGYAVTARIRCSMPPPVGHVYTDRTDWWSHVAASRGPRFVVVQDVDERPGLGAFVGEVHATILRALGCVAYATNGAVRDLPAVRGAGIQAFAGCTTPSHAFAHIVEFGTPVSVAGLSIAPGDLLLGDRHGLISIPAELAAAIPGVVAEMLTVERRVIELCRSEKFSIERLRSLVGGWE